MSTVAWILGAPLRVVRQSAQPYHEATLATLGRHELGLARQGGGSAITLDGRPLYRPGATVLDRAWFTLCRDLGYTPALHWDWDPALILFQQVVPALASDWHSPPLSLKAGGTPEGIPSLADLREAFAEAVSSLHELGAGPARARVVEAFEWLPLRAVAFHGEARILAVPRARAPEGRVSLWLGIHRDQPLVLDLPCGGGWTPEEGARTPAPEAFLAAAGLDPDLPEGFPAELTWGLHHLSHRMEPSLDAYRRSYPAGIPWHQDPRERLVGRTIVEVRAGDRPVLVLDDGTELAIDADPAAFLGERGI